MRKHIEYVVKHPLVSGSSIIFLGTFLTNILSYILNLFLGRVLTVSDYGIVVALLSFTVIFSLLQNSFTSTFAKFIAQYRASDQKNKIELLVGGGFQFVLIAGTIVMALLVIISPLVALYLKLDNFILLLLIYLYIFLSIIFSLPLGVMQGEMKFLKISTYNILIAVLKIAFAAGFVLLGFGIVGAISGYVVSMLVPTIVGLYLVIFRYKHLRFSFQILKEFWLDFRKYNIHFILATLGISVFNSFDVILVRNIFEPVLAGQYAALSLMGKSIFYITSPIYFVFFPLIVQKRESKQNVSSTLLLASLIIFSISALFSLVYILFPQTVLSIFFPASGYAMLVNHLGLFSVFIVIFSLVFLMNNYFLSIGKTAVYKINILFGIALVGSFYLFNTSLTQIIYNLITISFLLLLTHIIYYFYSNSRDDGK